MGQWKKIILGTVLRNERGEEQEATGVFRLCSVHSFEKVFQVFEAVVLFTQDAVGPLPPATATQHQSDKLSFKILCFCPKFHLEKVTCLKKCVTPLP